MFYQILAFRMTIILNNTMFLIFKCGDENQIIGTTLIQSQFYR